MDNRPLLDAIDLMLLAVSRHTGQEPEEVTVQRIRHQYGLTMAEAYWRLRRERDAVEK